MKRWVAFVAATVLAVAVLAGATTPILRSGAAAITAQPGCDPISAAQCLLPFPDNFFTRADASSSTGRRLAYPKALMPTNKDGTQVDPSDWNRSDGFSPGSAVIVLVPGVDLAVSGVAGIGHLQKSLDADAPIVLLDTNTNQRVPYWAERDTWNPNWWTKAIVIRPAKNFAEGHRIVVGLRNLKDPNGHAINAPMPFAKIRDNTPSSDSRLNARRPAINDAIDDLENAGIARDSLSLAWDFTVASSRSLAGGMLYMRNDAYTRLGSGVPAFHVTKVDENVNSDILRRVRGTFDVPRYLTGIGGPGSRLARDGNGLPKYTGTYQAEFRCLIPRSVVDSGGHVVPARGIVYGHGLLGSTDEIEGFGSFANEANVVVCATPWIGMSAGDITNVYNVIKDFSTFGSIPDRLQQSFLNFQFLARLIKDPNGFGSNTAFREGSPAGSVFLPNQVFFNGNSQGGILGGAVTAISKEWTRAVLGVPATNYSMLLPRSVDFDPFLPLLRNAYPDKRVHTLGVAFMQILWDRGDSDGYAQHMTDAPYAGTPKHTVLLIEAFGDHQVANIGTETEARTIGAYVRRPVLAPGRSDRADAFWGLPTAPPTGGNGFQGSVLEVWDFGTPAPPLASLPPYPPKYGDDPHGAARGVAAVRDQVSQFLESNGGFIDVCGADPCQFP